MVQRTLIALARAFLLLALLTYTVIEGPVIHTKFLYKTTYRSIFKITPIGNTLTGGTGFQIMTPEGPRIITNAHVCRIFRDQGVGQVNASNGYQFHARILKMATNADLCMLEGNEALPSLRLGNDVSLLDRVKVIGHPHLEPLTPSPGYIISRSVIRIALGLLTPEECEAEKGELIQSFIFQVCVKGYDAYMTNAIIYPGNSGSPVVDFFGRVVGVMFAGNNMTHNGLMVPYEYLREFINHPTPQDQNQDQPQSHTQAH